MWIWAATYRKKWSHILFILISFPFNVMFCKLSQPLSKTSSLYLFHSVAERFTCCSTNYFKSRNWLWEKNMYFQNIGTVKWFDFLILISKSLQFDKISSRKCMRRMLALVEQILDNFIFSISFSVFVLTVNLVSIPLIVYMKCFQPLWYEKSQNLIRTVSYS